MSKSYTLFSEIIEIFMKNFLKNIPSPVWALLVYTGTILFLIFSLKHLTLLAVPIFFSLIIAYLFNPVATFLEKKLPIPRSIVSGFLMILLVFLLIFVVVALLPYVIGQAKGAAERFPEFMITFAQKAQVLSEYLSDNFSEFLGKIDIMGKVEEMISLLLQDLAKILAGFFSSLYGVVVMLVYLVFIPLFAYYFLKDYYKIKNAIFAMLPVRYQYPFACKMMQLNKIVFSFVRGQAIVILILAFLYSVGLSIVGLPFAILIGIFAGIGDVIPYMGTAIGFVISLIVGFAHFGTIEKVLLVMLVFVIVKGSENWFFYPKIVGGEVGLHFVWVLLSIIIFGQLFGFWGLLLAIPSSAGLQIFIGDLVAYYKKSDYYSKE